MNDSLNQWVNASLESEQRAYPIGKPMESYFVGVRVARHNCQAIYCTWQKGRAKLLAYTSLWIILARDAKVAAASRIVLPFFGYADLSAI